MMRKLITYVVIVALLLQSNTSFTFVSAEETISSVIVNDDELSSGTGGIDNTSSGAAMEDILVTDDSSSVIVDDDEVLQVELPVQVPLSGSEESGIEDVSAMDTILPTANIPYSCDEGDITISDGTNSYTIQACNLGATTAGTGVASYGYYFQWGNNYGFPNRGDDFLSGDIQPDASGFGPGNYYDSGYYVKEFSDWSSVPNANLRGGSGDTQTTRQGKDVDRQGPCKDGYHIPSAYEWGELLQIRYNVNSGAIGKPLQDVSIGLPRIYAVAVGMMFGNDLLLPFAGYRAYGPYASVTAVNAYGSYWSSSSSDPFSERSYGLQIFREPFPRYDDSISSSSEIERANAYSLRCFKNSSPLPSIAAFTTTWDTRNTSTGSTNDTTINIPTVGGGYSGQVDWGDGVIDAFNGTAPNLTHTYPTAGVYQVKIIGDFPRIYFNNTGDRNKILSVDQWGDVQWMNMANAFYGCEQLEIPASDVPIFTGTTITVSGMFRGATTFNSPIEHWDMSNVVNMADMFYGASHFNQPLNNWDTSMVESMANMFYGASSFNQPLNNWKVGKVKTMQGMFREATTFNSAIDLWDTSNVADMALMFEQAEQFNQPLDTRDVSNVVNMNYMFELATNFDQPLNNWNTSNVTKMRGMFHKAINFNQPLSNWNTSNVTGMHTMFQDAINFNQPLATWTDSSGQVHWDVSNVTEMVTMFKNTPAFDQDLSSRNIENVTNLLNIFSGNTHTVGLSTQNYNAILDSRSKQNVKTGLDFGETTVQYGGCNVVNREAGIAGHNSLINNKGWTIIDGGLADCAPTPEVPSSSGGGGGSLTKDSCPNGDFSPSYYDGICYSDGVEDETTTVSGSGQDSEHNVADGDHSEDFSPAVSADLQGPYGVYERAKESHLTSAETYEDFQPNENITRAEVAKMVTSYMQSSLRGASITSDEAIQTSSGLPRSTSFRSQGQNRESCKHFTDLNTVNPELQSYIVQACELGLMGYYSDGKTIKESFLPNEVITRAEVATVISRMLRGTTNRGSEERWYHNHLLALRKEDIIKVNIDPLTLETRMNVFLMLNRIASS